MKKYDVIIIGAGSAGLMCAIEAGKRGRRVALLDHASKVGEKIRISGGGRCNFTNIHTSPNNFLSQNPRFCKSALSQYPPQDFINLIERYQIAYHEKTLGQLFCNETAKDIISMLLSECRQANVDIILDCKIDHVAKADTGYQVITSKGDFQSNSLVIATGGKSIPKMGATGFAYDIGKQFGHEIIDPTAALVPFTYDECNLVRLKDLSGIAVDAVVKCAKTSFTEAILFTHKGLSGPALLQISSYWGEGCEIIINMAPTRDAFEYLKSAKSAHPKQALHTILSGILPKRLAQSIAEHLNATTRIGELSDKLLRQAALHINEWRLIPSGTEGFRTAEVTKGGINTKELSSKTMESNLSPGLYFIGEAVDVTGHLGGYNFQWAWASGYAAGQFA